MFAMFISTVQRPRDRCYSSDHVVLTGSGNISSFLSRETACGSTSSPLVIEGKQGQHIDIYLWDFSGRKGLSVGDTISLQNQDAMDCQRGHVYAIIKDVLAPEGMKTKTLCGGKVARGSYSHVMRSLGSRLEIRIPNRTDSDMEFILGYEGEYGRTKLLK